MKKIKKTSNPRMIKYLYKKTSKILKYTFKQEIFNNPYKSLQKKPNLSKLPSYYPAVKWVQPRPSPTYHKTQTKNSDDNNYCNLAHKTPCGNRMLFGWPKHGKFDFGGFEAYWISKSFWVWCFIHAGWLTKSQ